MLSQNTDPVATAVLGATEETLDSLKAIKGEAFANCVLMGVNVKSLMNMHAMLYHTIGAENEQAQSIAMMIGILSAEYTGKLLNLLAEKAGLDKPDEVIEWVERIHDNANRIGNNAMKSPPPPGTLQ